MVYFQFREGSYMSNSTFSLNRHCRFFEAFAEFCKLDSGDLPSSSERLTLIKKMSRDIWSEQVAYEHSWRVFLVCGKWRFSSKKVALAGKGITITVQMVSWSCNQWMLKGKVHRNNNNVFFCPSEYACLEENWNRFRNFCSWEHQ